MAVRRIVGALALPALAVGVLGLGPMAAEGADTTSWTGEVLTRVSMTHSAEGHAAHGAGTMPMRTDVLLDTGTERLRLDTAGLPDLAFVAGGDRRGGRNASGLDD